MVGTTASKFLGFHDVAVCKTVQQSKPSLYFFDHVKDIISRCLSLGLHAQVLDTLSNGYKGGSSCGCGS